MNKTFSGLIYLLDHDYSYKVKEENNLDRDTEDSQTLIGRGLQKECRSSIGD